jgi:hypothetical protein
MVDIDLDTLIIMVYVFVDDWYKENKLVMYRPASGCKSNFTDAEALTLAIVSEWRAGVSWQSERGFVRYMHKHYRSWFKHLPQRSAFNERKRRLLGMLSRLQHDLADYLSSQEDVYQCVDCLPLPAGSVGQYTRDPGHWLWDSTIGRSKDGWFWGDQLLASICPSGVISGWLVGAAHLHDRWLLEALVSARQGRPGLIGPPHRPRSGHKARVLPPAGFIGGWLGVGMKTAHPYLADRGFNGHRWHNHWREHYQALVIAVPPDNTLAQRPWSRHEKRWLASHRQIVETVFAVFVLVFDIKHLKAHSRWGQYTRITAKIVAYHLGMWINRLLGRPLLSHETLLC